MSKLLPVRESNDVHQSHLELIKRLRDDLPSRVLAAIGFTGLLLWGIDGVAAIIWFAGFAFNEGLEIFIGMKSSKAPKEGALSRKLFCANMVFGSCIWVAGALALVKTGEIGPLIIGLAILLGALTHVTSTSLSYPPRFLVGFFAACNGDYLRTGDHDRQPCLSRRSNIPSQRSDDISADV